MYWGINNFREFFEVVAYITTSVSFVAIWITYSQSKKQIHFSTIEKCIDDYRELYYKYENKYENPKFLSQYLDLVNEELFYIEKDYLPIEVSEEWIDGMIDYLPFITSNEFVTSRKFLQFDTLETTEKKLFSYPRLYKFISINANVDFEKIFLPLTSKENLNLRDFERKKLIKILLKNLKANKY